VAGAGRRRDAEDSRGVAGQAGSCAAKKHKLLAFYRIDGFPAFVYKTIKCKRTSRHGQTALYLGCKGTGAGELLRLNWMSFK
jgi:hypothetical protein